MLDPFYLIVDNSKSLEELVPLGVKLVQLRIKNSDTGLLREEIRRAKKLCRKYNCKLIINDYWQLAIEEKCKFVHLGQEDLDSCDLSALHKNGIQLGISTHSEEELQRAMQAQNINIKLLYIALGPIYATKLKKMPWAPQGLKKIVIWKNKLKTLPLVAIGGFTPARALLALKAGAESVAVVTDISLHPQPKARTLEWIKATEPWRRT